MSQPTVILTGASAGIGFAMLEGLADEAFVLAVSRTRPPIANFNGIWISADLENPELAADEIEECLRSTGRGIDGMILCAASYGANSRHPFLDTSIREWDEVMSVNVRSQFVITSRMLPRLLERECAFIVAVSSNTATAPAPGRIAYGCSKAASYALYSGLAEELAESRVSVIQLMPDRQVTTRGLRRRRPPGFDFSTYIHPDVFKEPIRAIVKRRGMGMNRQCLVFAPQGVTHVDLRLVTG